MTIFLIYSGTEMSPEQQKQLIEIRKRKQELLLEIQVSNDHIKCYPTC